MGPEKRKFIRTNYPCKIIVCPPHEHVIFAHTENISAGGLRVIIDEELGVPTLVDLEINLTDEPIACKGKVVWVVEKPSAFQRGFVFFDTGIEFCEISEKDRKAIKKFVDKIIKVENGS